mmetsp:Transcript_103484/g.183829  ORF Transcript_103484/g.183829 Transcript_103484/m.183829 type:complete len:234 (+) Transcript_103484:95-796(+)|eukprot:CAMPEP_0197624022 /NCGR_PEP_ID=MMETSP1338-20131121/3846_1 /TAXON_ID=43686 ORGANISM="Pelagodinium beii, Strain RCC1491" /NCGR_SAMPLE_ID=MMETSP1338 /ASSEMBLY_ACC=CAM_ASM_000754 /LENGTH=233 /DNA_ID=CAMNT_0043194117 /DNA_START=95 /DNA_END=796 /DNA_ORIENTATION=-
MADTIWAGKKLQDGITSGEVNQQWFFCIPIQIGPATEYARSLQHWFMLIILIQAAETVMQIILIQEFVTGLLMGFTAIIALYAWHQDMNITYICAWGIFCLVQAVTTTIGDLLPAIESLATLDVTSIVAMATAPLVYLFSAAFAWHLYNDYRSHHGKTALDFDPFAKYAEKYDLGEKIPLNEGIFDKAANRMFGSTETGGWFGAKAQNPFETLEHQVQDAFPAGQRGKPDCCC